MHETYGKNPRIYPESLMEAAKKVPQKYERVITDERGNALHRVNFAKACKGQAKPVSEFEYATRLTETMLLGIVALKTGQAVQIVYDGEAGKVTKVNGGTGRGDTAAEANQYLQREYRKGWTL